MRMLDYLQMSNYLDGGYSAANEGLTSGKSVKVRWEKRTFKRYYATAVPVLVWIGDKPYWIFSGDYEWEEEEYEAWVKIYEEIDSIGMGIPVEIRAYPDIDQPYDRSAPWMRIANGNQRAIFRPSGCRLKC